MLVEESGARILIDPGAWTTVPDALPEIDAILITHEHPDHFHLETVKKVLMQSPDAALVAVRPVAEALKNSAVNAQTLEHGGTIMIKNVLIEAVGSKHALIYRELPVVDNTGYMIAGRFFYPGDALTAPDKPVEILALPIVAPWMRLAEAIDYAKTVKPKICFPVHDGMLKITGPYYMLPGKFLTPAEINFVVLEQGKGKEF